MNKSKRLIVTILLTLVIILGMIGTVSATIGDGITATIISDPLSGQEVKIGDEITYKITIKNNSDRAYAMPVLMTQVPEGTEYVSITTTDMPAEPDVDETTGMVACFGTILDAQSEQVFTLKVKVLETAKEEINYANVSENDQESAGVVMYMLFNSFDETELNETFEIIESQEFMDTATKAEAQALLGERAYIDIVTMKQTQTIAKADEQPNEDTNKNEQTEQKPEDTKIEPVVKEEKPTQLPKTGKEINYTIIALVSIMIIAGIAMIAKKQK